MTIVLYILGAIVGLFVLILIIALFVRKGYSVYREVTISKPVPEVFNYIRLLKNQDHYSKFNQADPNMQKIFKGTDGTEGFIYGWNGNKKAGEGEQEIKKIVDGKQIDTEIRFVRPFAGIANASMTTQTARGGQTKVQWSFQSEMKYPMNVTLLFMDIEKFLGSDLEISLTNLKRNLE